MVAALVLLGVVLTTLAFSTGGLQAQKVPPAAWRLSAYDVQGQRRFALTLSLRERPDIAIFNAAGRRLGP